MDGRSPVQNVTREVEALYNIIPIDGAGQFTIAIGAEADDPISLELGRGHYPGAYQFILGMLQQSVPPGGRVLDLGAFIGCFSLGSRWRALRSSRSRPRPGMPPSLTTASSGMASQTWCSSIPWSAIAQGNAGVPLLRAIGHVCSPSSGTRGLEIPCITVDDLLQQLGWDHVDFVKMDVEGSEVAAIRGMTRLLRREDAPPIFYESNGHTLNFFRLTPKWCIRQEA